MTTNVTIGEKVYPAKWSTRAKVNWENKMQVALADLVPRIIGKDDNGEPIIKQGVTMTTDMAMHMCLEALRAGHLFEKKKFKLTIFDIYNLNDEYELEPIFLPIIYPKTEDEKKSTGER